MVLMFPSVVTLRNRVLRNPRCTGCPRHPPRCHGQLQLRANRQTAVAGPAIGGLPKATLPANRLMLPSEVMIRIRLLPVSAT